MINNSGNSVVDNSRVFFQVWRNHYLKNKIMLALQRYNFHYYNVLVRSYLIKDSFLRDLQDGYIQSLVLYSNGSKEKLLHLLSLLPNSTDYSIQFGDHGFNENFQPGELPSFIKKIVFNLKWNQQIDLNVLPSRNLRTIIFNQEYNKPILANVLPTTLTHIEFGNDYNHPLDIGVLNQGLRVLKFSNRSDFNHPLVVGSLPSSITSIYFGKFYNQSLEPAVLPLGLKSLQFFSESLFNKPFKFNSLPSSIEILYLGAAFNQPLYFDDNDNSSSNNNSNNNKNNYIYKSILPNNLKKLKFHNQHYKQIKSTIFDSGASGGVGGIFSFINQFKANSSYYIIPDSIVSLYLSSLLLIDKDCLFSNSLSNLKTLSIGLNIKNLKSLPSSVEKLVIDLVLPSSFPAENNIKYLKIGNQFDTPIKNELLNLKKLVRLEFGSSFDHPIKENSIPESVEFIDFGEYFNQDLHRSQLPKNLKHISLGHRYTKPFQSGASSFPLDLVSLRLGKCYWRDITRDQLPKSLKILELGLDYKLDGSDFLTPSLEKLIIRGHIQKRQQLPPLPSTISTLFIHSSFKYLVDSPYNKEDSLESLLPIVRFFSNNRPFLEDENEKNACDYLFKNLVKSKLK